MSQRDELALTKGYYTKCTVMESVMCGMLAAFPVGLAPMYLPILSS